MSSRNGNICWGVYRELAHSPGRETDDAEILRATGRHLEAKGFSVELRTPEEIAGLEGGLPPFLFVMCERLPILEHLAGWARRGVVSVNSPEGIRNTYRDQTIGLFERASVRFPGSRIVSTRPGAVSLLGLTGPQWVKRADVHATQAGDVAFAAEPGDVRAALGRLADRGIGRAVVQEHVPGDLVKFYGVGTDGGERRWFQWFYHRDQVLKNHRFDEAALKDAAAGAARCLGLEVYGGDAIVREDGSLFVIDLNAWPSFALYRDVASERIATHLAARFLKEVGVPR
jgi:hypothetical protein